ncbi:MAG: hypothetical protein Q4P06_05660 [Actinomycetaceae bacterium]|nr:hypothetical protein [Actinomycetaceae bacterium]
MSDPTSRSQDEPTTNEPEWLLHNDRERSEVHPDLLDPTPDSPVDVPEPAGTDSALRIEPAGNYSDDSADIVGTEPEPSVDLDPSAIPHEMPEDEFAFQVFADSASSADSDDDDEDVPVAYPMLTDDAVESDPDAPVDVLARRQLPEQERPERPEYDLTRLQPRQPEEEEDEPTVVQRQSLFASEPVEDETTVAPAAGSVWKPLEDPQAGIHSDADQALFEESSVIPDLPSRAGARLWSFFLTLLLVPVTWYLLADAAARLTLAANNPWQTGVINPAALLEFAGGAVLLIVILAFLVRSSLGALVWGFVLMAGGAVFLAVPNMVKDFIAPAQDWLTSWNAFGGNVDHHVEWTGSTGVLLLAGIALFTLGILAILARRDGRREAEVRAQIERLAPGTFTSKRKRR